MKNKYLLVIALILFFTLNIDVKADASFKCTGGGVTCEFNRTQNALNGTCKDSNGKELSMVNHNGNTFPTQRDMDKATNRYTYQDGTKCPDYILYSPDSGQVAFMNTATYHVPCGWMNPMPASCSGEDDVYDTTSIAALTAYINAAWSEFSGKTHNFSYSKPTQSETDIGTDCDTKLNILRDRIEKARKDAVNYCKSDNKSSECKKYNDAFKKELDSVRVEAKNLLNEKVCNGDQYTAFVDRYLEYKSYYYENGGDDELDESGDPQITVYTDFLQICDSKENPKIVAAFRLVGILINIVKILVPIIIIVLGMYQFSQAVIDKDEDAIPKTAKKFIIRIIAGILVFFAPSVILAAFHLVDGMDNIESKYSTCVDCLLGSSKCPKTSFIGDK